jgi:diguanylate cyclase (GGDEF)-like protein
VKGLAFSKTLTLAAGIAGVMLIGVIDYFTGYEVRLFPLYFLPIAFVAWRLHWHAAAMLAVMSAGAWALSNSLAGKVYTSSLTWPVNFLSQLIAFGTVGILVAVLRRKLDVEKSLSRQDSLTSLPNSRAFQEQADLILAIARRSGRPFTLAYLDLDNFKKINDQSGHQEGDRALRETAEVLRRRLRTSDLVARLGGDEFAIVLTDTPAEAAATPLERVRGFVDASMRSNAWPVTVSIGAVSYATAPSTLDEALRAADALMYRVKAGGKDRVRIEPGDGRG